MASYLLAGGVREVVFASVLNLLFALQDISQLRISEMAEL
jgi:hypothetical protein